MLLKVVFLFYWKKNYFNHCLKSILTKKYCLLIFFFSFSAWNSVKEKKNENNDFTQVSVLFLDTLMNCIFKKAHLPSPHTSHLIFTSLWSMNHPPHPLSFIHTTKRFFSILEQSKHPGKNVLVGEGEV